MNTAIGSTLCPGYVVDSVTLPVSGSETWCSDPNIDIIPAWNTKAKKKLKAYPNTYNIIFFIGIHPLK